LNSNHDRFSAALHGTARAWRMVLDRRLKHLGLSQTSWLAIAYIAKEATPLSQTQLANRVGVEDPTMVTTIDRLVKAGFMVRTPSGTDRRVKLLSLTPAGVEIYNKVKAEADIVRSELLRHADPEAIRVTTEFLESLRATLEDQP
jgi:MarR family transcriptional regulator for hemolysin